MYFGEVNKVVSYKFISKIRKEGKQRVINVPKMLHDKVEADMDHPYSVEVVAKVLYPKKK